MNRMCRSKAGQFKQNSGRFCVANVAYRTALPVTVRVGGQCARGYMSAVHSGLVFRPVE